MFGKRKSARRRRGEPGQDGDTVSALPKYERRRPARVRRPSNPRVSVIVPAMNEAANIPTVLPALADYHEVILVDGHSTDGTVEAARLALPSVRVIEQTRTGKGNAMACGFAVATGEAIVMFDADGSADPAEIPRFVQVLVDGADLAKGSRFLDGGGSEDITRFRRLGNSGLNALANVLIGRHMTDLCYGYNAFWADQLYLIDLPDTNAETDEPMLPGDGFEIESLIIGRFALSSANITEVPSFERVRHYGTSNLNSVRDGVRVLRTILEDRMYARRIRRLAHRRQSQNLPAPAIPGWARN